MERAKILLLRGPAPVPEIACSVGYSNVSHFPADVQTLHRVQGGRREGGGGGPGVDRRLRTGLAVGAGVRRPRTGSMMYPGGDNAVERDDRTGRRIGLGERILVVVLSGLLGASALRVAVMPSPTPVKLAPYLAVAVVAVVILAARYRDRVVLVLVGAALGIACYLLIPLYYALTVVRYPDWD
jgi:hypothetical protein